MISSDKPRMAFMRPKGVVAMEVIVSARELTVLRKPLAKLTRTQRQQLVAEPTAEERQFASVAVIESARTHRKCPHCGAERIVKKGAADGRQRFKCRAVRQDVQCADRHATGALAPAWEVAGASRCDA